MKKIYNNFHCTILILFFLSNQLHAEFSFDSIKAFFGVKVYEQELNQEYQIEKPGILTLQNINGNIRITESKEKKLFVKAVKKAKEETHFSSIYFNVNKLQEHEVENLHIQSILKDPSITGSIDFTLVVPAGMQVRAQTKNGSITIDQAQEDILVKTDKGAITIKNSSKTITAQTINGPICIANALGNISAITQKGNITIHGAKQSIIAKANKGKIEVTSLQVPDISKIHLTTDAGNISLALPKKTNARLCGKTNQGKIISEIPIKLKPRVTQLNRHAWARVKKEVEGTIGTGETDITLKSLHGTIRIGYTVV